MQAVNQVLRSRSSFVTTLGLLFVLASSFFVITAVIQNIIVFSTSTDYQDWHATPDAKSFASMYGFVFEHIKLVNAAILAFAIGLLATSIGFIRRKHWARQLILLMLIVGIIWNIFEVAVWQLIESSISISNYSNSAFPLLIIVNILVVAKGVGVAALFWWVFKRLTDKFIRAEFL